MTQRDPTPKDLPALHGLYGRLLELDSWLSTADRVTIDVKRNEAHRALEIDHLDQILSQFMDEISQARTTLAKLRNEVEHFRDQAAKAG